MHPQYVCTGLFYVRENEKFVLSSEYLSLKRIMNRGGCHITYDPFFCGNILLTGPFTSSLIKKFKSIFHMKSQTQSGPKIAEFSVITVY